MLEIRDLHVRYGGIQAVQGVSLSIPRGSIVTLIGANGAGKSSIIRSIAGLNKTISGEILFTRHEGEEPVSLMGLKPEGMVRKGISLSPEGRRILPHLSVEENLYLGAYSRKEKDEIAADLEWVYTLSRASRSAPGRRRAPCPAASSRCWLWAAPSCPAPRSS